MPTEGALTSQSSMKCHVTVDSGDGIVSWEQQEQECQTNAFVGIDVIQFFQAGWMTTILQWKTVKFPEGSAFPSCPMAVADSYWTSPWSTVGLITFTVLLHHRNVQGATVVQTKCKEKNFYRYILTLVKICCIVLLYKLRCFTKISSLEENRDCVRVKLHFCVSLFDIANLLLTLTHLSWQSSSNLFKNGRNQNKLSSLFNSLIICTLKDIFFTILFIFFNCSWIKSTFIVSKSLCCLYNKQNNT